jgi:hypothetical protein
VVGALSAGALLSEGEMEQSSGVYLSRTLGLSALLGGSGVAVFYGAMAFGRLSAAFVVGASAKPPDAPGGGAACGWRDD